MTVHTINGGKKWGENQKEDSKIECSLVVKPIIYIEMRARLKITYLMEEYTSREWLAYLVGTISEKGNYFIEDIVVPPHKESYCASAEAEPLYTPKEGCIGIIHSHHGMGAFHSGTDQTYVDKNYPISITVARGEGSALKYDTVSVTETPCGKPVTMKDCEVKYIQPEPDFDAEKWLEESKKNIDKGVYKTPVTTYPYNPYQGYQNIGHKPGETPWYKKQQGALPETEVPSSTTMITHQRVREIRKQIHETRGVLLTRAQIEDWLQTNTSPVGEED